jgi:predicted transcriptional regulator
VVGPSGTLAGVLPWSHILAGIAVPGQKVRDAMISAAVAVAYPDEILRVLADRMAAARIGAVPVVSRETCALEGIITQFSLLQAREKLLTEERHAERILTRRRVQARDPENQAEKGATV